MKNVFLIALLTGTGVAPALATEQLPKGPPITSPGSSDQWRSGLVPMPEDPDIVVGLKSPPWNVSAHAQPSNAPVLDLDVRVERQVEGNVRIVQMDLHMTVSAYEGAPFSVTNEQSFVSSIGVDQDKKTTIVVPKIFRSGFQMLITPHPHDDGTVSLNYHVQGVRVTDKSNFKGVDIFSWDKLDVSGDQVMKPGVWTALKANSGDQYQISFRVSPHVQCRGGTTLCL